MRSISTSLLLWSGVSLAVHGAVLILMPPNHQQVAAVSGGGALHVKLAQRAIHESDAKQEPVTEQLETLVRKHPDDAVPEQPKPGPLLKSTLSPPPKKMQRQKRDTPVIVAKRRSAEPKKVQTRQPEKLIADFEVMPKGLSGEKPAAKEPEVSVKSDLPKLATLSLEMSVPAVVAPPAVKRGDANRLSELYQRIHQEIGRHKRYPLSARMRGKQGRVRIQFDLRQDGQLEEIGVSQSSGIGSLDRAALKAVRAIAPFTIAERYIDSTQRVAIEIQFITR
ncbi:MAG: energy transducer TonB [Gammaproteobacteria bacterium]|nr:energy transducer TonB [Gammaproteobacteria bacterium]